MAEQPYTREELQTAARANAALWGLPEPSGGDYDTGRAVLSAVAPLIAARVRAEVAEQLDRLAEHHSPEARLVLHSAAAHVLACAYRTTPEEENHA